MKHTTDRTDVIFIPLIWEASRILSRREDLSVSDSHQWTARQKDKKGRIWKSFNSISSETLTALREMRLGMEWNKFAFQSTIAAPPTMFSRFILVPNMHKSINMTPARESWTGRKVRGERRFPIYRQTTTFLWFYRIGLTSQNIIRLKLPSVLTCCGFTPSGLILGLCDGLVSDSRGLSMDTPFLLPVVFSPSAARNTREKCFFSPTRCNRKHLPWCEMCPYRIHAEVERGVEEFYPLWTKLSSYNRNKAGMNSLMISESRRF